MVSVDPSSAGVVEEDDTDDGDAEDKTEEDTSLVGSVEFVSDIDEAVTDDRVVVANSVTMVLRTSITTAWLGG